MNKKQTVAIVDSYSSGRLLSKAIKNKGFDLIHVSSAQQPPECYAGHYEKELFLENIVYDGNLNDLISKIKSYEPHLIIPGAECGVELADLLSESLGTLSNGTNLSHARRDKYEMVEALKKAGLQTVNHFRSNNINDIKAWINSETEYPVVIKPIKSAGADSVVKCNTEIDVERAFYNIIGKNNQLGILNHSVLVQSFLEGTEYIVNTVSRNSNHYISDIWECHKQHLPGHGWISCMEELIAPSTANELVLTKYAKSVLAALNIQHGPAHFEIMLTKNGPILIEVGARIQGAIHLPSLNYAIGTNQVDLTVEALFDENEFLKRTRAQRTIVRHMFHAFLISPKSGLLKSIPGIPMMQTLKTYYQSQIKIEPNNVIRKTIDLFSSPGIVDLIHENPALLWQDYNSLREAEAKGKFYNV